MHSTKETARQRTYTLWSSDLFSGQLIAHTTKKQLTLWESVEHLRTVHVNFGTHNRWSAFEDSQDAKRILLLFRHISQKHHILLHEAAIMLGHSHLLISFAPSRHLEKDVLKKLKGASAHYFMKDFENNGFKQRHLWSRGRHFEDISSEQYFQNVIRYIRNNPTSSNISSVNRILSQLP